MKGSLTFPNSSIAQKLDASSEWAAACKSTQRAKQQHEQVHANAKERIYETHFADEICNFDKTRQFGQHESVAAKREGRKTGRHLKKFL